MSFLSIFGFRRFRSAGATAVAEPPTLTYAERTARDKEKLTKALGRKKFTWRTQTRLMSIIGTKDVFYVRQLLEEIGARASYYNSQLWALKDKVGNSGRRRGY